MDYDYLEQQQQAFKRNGHKNGTLRTLEQAEARGYLFHGAPIPNGVQGLMPNTSPLLHYESVVYGGNRFIALLHCAFWNNKDLDVGEVEAGQKRYPYVKELRHGIIDKLSHQGYVHAIEPTHFERRRELASFEYVATRMVKPRWTFAIRNPYVALVELGVQFQPVGAPALQW